MTVWIDKETKTIYVDKPELNYIGIYNMGLVFGESGSGSWEVTNASWMKVDLNRLTSISGFGVDLAKEIMGM